MGFKSYGMRVHETIKFAIKKLTKLIGSLSALPVTHFAHIMC